MIVCSVLQRLLVAAPLVLWLAGCSFTGDNPVDEEKDPYFLAGRNRLSSMDYEGAITAFENALESNPKSAAAHLQLGFLYEERKPNFATAIYHFERHLELRPQSNMAETVRQHILACKLQLARTVPFAMVNQQVQADLSRLYTTNAALKQEIERLKNQLLEENAAWSNRLAQATQAAQAAQAALQNQPRVAPGGEGEHVRTAPERSTAAATSNPPARATSSPRTHQVKSGETLATIAKRYNIRLSSLEAANPTVDPHRLKVGQTLKLPGGKDGQL
jgi:LysM repeat protein